MSDNIVELVPDTVNESLVELLEDLLERARSGQLAGMAGVSQATGGEFAEFYTTNAIEEDTLAYMTYLRVLQLRFERHIPTDD